MRLKRRLGFGAWGEGDAVVVGQANALNVILPTLLVVPLDPAIGSFGRQTPVIRVSREEAGSRVDHLAIPWQLRALSADSLAPGPAGRLRPATLAALDDLLKLVLDLP